MKNSAFLLCFLLLTVAFSACTQDSTDTSQDTETALEDAAADVSSNATTSPETEATPETPTDETPAATAAPSLNNPLFNYTWQKGQAGAVRIGMTIQDLRKQYGENKLREIDLIQEGMSSVAYEVLGERDRPSLRVEQDCTGGACTVSRITVLHPAFKNAGGVGIGSTFNELKKNFTITRVTPGEEHFVAVASGAKTSFFLDLGDIPASKWSSLKLKDIPNNATVTGLLLY